MSIRFTDDHERLYHCLACRDTGFTRDLECSGHGACNVSGCGGAGTVAQQHTYTRRCFCRATNPHLMALRERANEKASATEAASSRRHHGA